MSKPKAAGKGGRRKSLLDMKVDKGSVAAAAAENLKALLLPPMPDDDDDDSGREDEIKSVIAFARDSVSAAPPSIASGGHSSAQRQVNPRLSIRSSMTGRRSSVGESSRGSVPARPGSGGLERLSSS